MNHWKRVASGFIVILGLAGCSTSLPGRGIPLPVTTAESAANGTTGNSSGERVFDRAAVETGVVNLIKNIYNMDATAASSRTRTRQR